MLGETVRIGKRDEVPAGYGIDGDAQALLGDAPLKLDGKEAIVGPGP